MRRYEIIIIGGGISGLGVAARACQLGLSPLLLEAKSVAAATSNNTLRIIHGGFRYLQQLNLPRVIRSLNDQTKILSRFGDAVAPLPCLMPLSARGLKSKPFVAVAALSYGAIMKLNSSPLPAPKVLSQAELKTIAPELAPHAPNGALLWHDVVMRAPLKLAHALTQEISQSGGETREHSPVAAISKDSDGFQITLTSGEILSAERVVTTLGPWLDTIQIPSNLRGIRPKWCLGFNLVSSRQLHPTHAIAVQSRDGRLFFCVPRGSGTAIGTWYVSAQAPDSLTPSSPSEQEIASFLESFNKAYYGPGIKRDEIASIDYGLLPACGDSPTGPVLYGEELLHQSSGYCEVLSTKYTTFSSQAERVLRAVRGE